MPQEATTLDLVGVRRGLEADSYDEFATFLERYIAADAVWDLSEVGLGTFEGLAAILAQVKEYWSTWAEHHHDVEDILDLGHGVGCAVLREDGRMKGSDARVEARHAWVTISDAVSPALSVDRCGKRRFAPAAEGL